MEFLHGGYVSDNIATFIKITLANPGTILAGKNQMLKGGISQPRNKGLFKMFNLISYGEHAGSGVPDIFQAWKDAGLAAPIVEEFFGNGNPDRTIVTLPLMPLGSSTNSNVANKSLTEDDLKKLVDFCSEPKSRQEMMDYMSLSSRAHFSKYHIKPLIKANRLVMTEPDNPRSPSQKYVKA